MRRFESHAAAPRTAFFRLNGFIDSLQFAVRIAAGGGVPVEKQSAVRCRGLEEEVGRAGRIDIFLMPAGAVRQSGDRTVIAQQRRRVGGQGHRRVFDGIVPVLHEQVVARGEAAGGLVVEVVFRNRIGRVVDQGDARFDVFADHLVDLLERSAFVPGVEVGFGVVHIGYAQAVPCCCRVVGHAEHVCQYEMGISPANQRFAFAGLEPRGGRSSQLLDGRKRLVGVGDVVVVRTPDVPRGVVVAGNLFGPFVDILMELVVILCDAVVADVVRGEFRNELVAACSADVGRDEYVGDLLFGIQRRAQIGILIQKIAARHECRNDDRYAQ